MLCQFLLYSKVSQLYIYLYSLFCGFPSHLGSHRALSRVPCAIQQVLISYLFYTQYQQLHICQFQSSNSSHPHFPLWYPYTCSLHLCLCLCFCFVNKIVYTNFFRSHIYTLIYDTYFSLSYFTKSIQVSTNDPISFFSWLSNIPLYMCVCVCVCAPRRLYSFLC